MFKQMALASLLIVAAPVLAQPKAAAAVSAVAVSEQPAKLVKLSMLDQGQEFAFDDVKVKDSKANKVAGDKKKKPSTFRNILFVGAGVGGGLGLALTTISG